MRNIQRNYASESKSLTREDEKRLFLLMKKGNVEARDRIIKAHLRVAYKVAEKFGAFRKLPVETTDLEQYAVIGMMNAVDKFDLNRGSRFASYAGTSARNHIIKSLADELGIKLPRRKISQMSKISKACEKLFFLTGETNPSIAQISEISGLTPKIVREVQCLLPRVITSLDAPISNAGDSGGDGSTLMDITVPEDRSAEDKKTSVLTSYESITKEGEGDGIHLIRRWVEGCKDPHKQRSWLFYELASDLEVFTTQSLSLYAPNPHSTRRLLNRLYDTYVQKSDTDTQ
jgi:RNA polymerase sigma factor (sigma-70 family)